MSIISELVLGERVQVFVNNPKKKEMVWRFGVITKVHTTGLLVTGVDVKYSRTLWHHKKSKFYNEKHIDTFTRESLIRKSNKIYARKTTN